MMGHTDRHGRFFMRLMSPRVRLYTEMIAAPAILHGDRERLLGFSPEEPPLALQLAGRAPQELAAAACWGEAFGYEEINLNVGCPSRSVQSCGWGAALMRTPERVAECVAALRAAVHIPISVKCRLGVDEQDPRTTLFHFVDTVAQAGCRVFFIHARKAWLQGVNPKQNRTLPPLDYELVYALKRERPQLTIILNGGVRTASDCVAHLAHVDGVMVGRAAYEDPWMIAAAARRIFGTPPPPPQKEILKKLSAYVARGAPTRAVCRHVMGLFRAQPHARTLRRLLTEAPPGVLDKVAQIAISSQSAPTEGFHSRA